MRSSMTPKKTQPRAGDASLVGGLGRASASLPEVGAVHAARKRMNVGMQMLFSLEQRVAAREDDVCDFHELGLAR